MGKIAQMCSEPVVSQHNDLKGMLVPGISQWFRPYNRTVSRVAGIFGRMEV